METISAWHDATLGQRAVKALEKNKFAAAYFPDAESAVSHILGLVPEGVSVGVGGSMTIQALGLTGKLPGRTILDHNVPGLPKDEVREIRYKQLASDVFLTGTNAVTLKGELVNVDGTGNRVAAMFFGPKKIIVIAGANKIVRNLDEAQARIRMIAAPLNNKRLNLPNPCVQTGECMDCNNATRICNVTTIISRCPSLSEIHVILIGGQYGY